jgi:signal peptidase II
MFDLQLFDFAVFNVADIYVTVAMFLILIYAFFIDPKIEKKLKAEKEAEVKDE